MHIVGRILPTARDLTNIAEYSQSTGLGELDGVVVEDFADLPADADLPSTHA